MPDLEPRAPFSVSRGSDTDPWPRHVNATLGVWLFLSAFLWTHLLVQWGNAWIVGALIFAVAIFGAAVPRARFANTVLALWLFASAIFLASTSGTKWNNVIVAVLVFAFSLVPNGRGGPLLPRPLA